MATAPWGRVPTPSCGNCAKPSSAAVSAAATAVTRWRRCRHDPGWPAHRPRTVTVRPGRSATVGGAAPYTPAAGPSSNPPRASVRLGLLASRSAVARAPSSRATRPPIPPVAKAGPSMAPQPALARRARLRPAMCLGPSCGRSCATLQVLPELHHHNLDRLGLAPLALGLLA